MKPIQPLDSLRSLGASPLIREIPADLDTPVSAFLKLKPEGANILLESVEQGGRFGRCSFIGLDSPRAVRLYEDRLVVRDVEGERTLPFERSDLLGTLRRHLMGTPVEPLPFPSPVGGAVGYCSYDFARLLERLPSKRPDPLGLPLGCFLFPTLVVAFDHLRRKIIIAATSSAAEARMSRVMDLLRRPLVLPALPAGGKRASFTSATPESAYRSAVETAKEHVRRGDVFQVVLSRRDSAPLGVDPFQVYRSLRILNPSPYLYFLDFGDHQIVGSSPEIHARLSRGRATVRPIAGTRRRGAEEAEDAALERELLADEKERSEHLMLVDLGRNDLGRCCAHGTVKPAELFAVEKYSHVMHIVSQIDGRLAPGRDALDLLAATFPAGTVSGAPKIRAMEIIEDLEPVRRGPYAGAVGYLSPSGDMDFCITLRTMIVKQGIAHLQAGAGIVLDSDPAREYEETVNKMAALKEAIAMAEAGL